MKQTIKCWTCNVAATVQGEEPETGEDLITLAERVDWISAVDFNRTRVLIFCSPKCEKKAKTKQGLYRKSPPRK